MFPVARMRTPSSRSGRSAFPIAKCSRGVRKASMLSWTTGTSAIGNAFRSTDHVPWSRPQDSSSATSRGVRSAAMRRAEVRASRRRIEEMAQIAVAEVVDRPRSLHGGYAEAARVPMRGDREDGPRSDLRADPRPSSGIVVVVDGIQRCPVADEDDRHAGRNVGRISHRYSSRNARCRFSGSPAFNGAASRSAL